MHALKKLIPYERKKISGLDSAEELFFGFVEIQFLLESMLFVSYVDQMILHSMYLLASFNMQANRCFIQRLCSGHEMGTMYSPVSDMVQILDEPT
jgi:hypothetical protein